MSHKEQDLIDQLTNAIAAAESATVNANAAAASATSTANARTQSNTEKAGGVTTDLTDITKNIDSDIGIPEAWSANVKRTYDVHQTYDVETQSQHRTQFNVLANQLQTHLANLNQLTVTALANNQNQSNLNNTLSIDRAWNINETDAFAVLLNKVVAEAVQKATA